MCDDCHEENEQHEHEENEAYVVGRIILSLLIFAAGFKFKLLFILAYLIAGGDVLFRAAKNVVKGKVFDENFLMSVATLGALAIKEFPEAVMVMVLYQTGEYLQHKAVERSRNSIAELMDIRPDYANLDGKRVSPKDVKVGEVITVNPGEKIPLDGVVISGVASVDTSSLTGESLPRTVKIGDDVISGCIDCDGVLKIRVTKEFGESTVSKILELVENASSKKAQTENFITKFARYYTPAVVLFAVLLGVVFPFLARVPFTPWVARALTFLVISCPCALVISIPLSFFAGIGGASKQGILIKGSTFIETLSKPSVAVFDKTGTLTKGVFKVTEISSENPDLIRYAAYAESASSHPIAAAIRKEYGKAIPEVDDIKEVAGKGVEANIEGKLIKVGNAKFIGCEPVDKFGTVIYVSADGIYQGYIVISDEVKEDSKDAVSRLKKLGVFAEILTGDTYKTAEVVQKELGVDKVYAELLPQDKVNKIEDVINSSQGSVIFVGDGINDAPVLTRADVGIAMGGLGSDAAIEAADVVIMDDKPSKVADAVQISRKTMRIVKQNIVFALGVKGLFLILGGLGMMTMWGAVFADVGVSFIAILNALRALKVRK